MEGRRGRMKEMIIHDFSELKEMVEAMEESQILCIIIREEEDE